MTMPLHHEGYAVVEAKDFSPLPQSIESFVSFVLLSMIISAAWANFSGAEASSDSDIPRAKHVLSNDEGTPSWQSIFFFAPFAFFARDRPNFGCGVAAL
jgi:hypothetical protein